MDVNAEVVRVMKEKTTKGMRVGKIIAGIIGVVIFILFLNPFVIMGAGREVWS